MRHNTTQVVEIVVSQRDTFCKVGNCENLLARVNPLNGMRSPSLPPKENDSVSGCDERVRA